MFNLYIFTRDLRIFDNSGLYFCQLNYNNIIPIFIFTPEQIGKQNNFRSNNSIQFMYESINQMSQHTNSSISIETRSNLMEIISFAVNQGVTQTNGDLIESNIMTAIVDATHRIMASFSDIDVSQLGVRQSSQSI